MPYSQLFEKLKNQHANIDTLRIGKYYINENIKESVSNKPLFECMRKTKRIYEDYRQDLLDGVKNLEITIPEVREIKPTGYKKAYKNGKSFFKPLLNIELLKGSYPLVIKQETAGNLWMQVDFSLLKFLAGKKIAIGIENNEINSSEGVEELINFVEKSMEKIEQKLGIEPSQNMEWGVKRMDIFKDISWETKAENRNFISQTGADEPPEGHSTNVIVNGETVVWKPREKFKHKFPRETIYNKTLEAEKEFNVILKNNITRDELRFDSTQIQNNPQFRTIGINRNRVYNKFTGKEVDLQNIVNKQFDIYSHLKDYDIPAPVDVKNKIQRKKFNENEEIYYEIIRSAYHSGDGFIIDSIKEYFNDLKERTIYNRINDLVKVGVLKRVAGRTLITARGKKYFEIECEIKTGEYW